ncbi:MAG: DUF1549 and DUF1553 domain-containing protein [Verrucomicrobiota bacterium]|nr:DUF1549 and DUF1553 domain-containing protein [Verrucomicrobiota bacterium]
MELNNRNHFILLICLFCFVGCLKSLRADEKIEPKGHWAFQSIKRPHVPDEFTRDPIRWFILKALDEAKIPMSSSADRRDWIRRLYYNLTGLPPSYSELIKLENDKRSDSEISRELVEVLLGSTRYGEHWARLWLDVARYSDTKGYAYGSEEFNFPHAWLYRDWVIDSFNKDLSYKKFVLMQLAADLMLGQGLCDRSDLAAMGYLTLGRRFISVEPDIIDDRIDVVTRGLMGLTVSCARCHDHKFDPIPTKDYYSLYGVFKSSQEELTSLNLKNSGPLAELNKKKDSLAQEFEKKAQELESRFLVRSGEYMLAALKIEEVPPPDFAEIIEKDDLNPAQIRRWYEYLSQNDRKMDPVFRPWIALAKLNEKTFSDEVETILNGLSDSNGLVISKLREMPLMSMSDVANCYADLFQSVGKNPQSSIDCQQLIDVVSGKGSPIRVPRDYIHDVEWLFDEGSKTALKKMLADIEREIIRLGEEAPHSLILVDRSVPLNVNVFNRGDYSNQGQHVERGYLSMFGTEADTKFTKGSGRLELAKKIVSKDNPLTARVIVNRIWRAHFGEGLVKTESDFGLRSRAPSHPELLDFLASELIDSDWSIKHIQRLITTSSVSRIFSSAFPIKDPENRLLSVYPRRRLSFESMRDTMLSISGELDLRSGGPPKEMFGTGASKRRSVYGKIDRQFLPSVLRVFDFANPELHAPRRYKTNVPQQALFLMNSDFAIDRAKALSVRVHDDYPSGDIRAKINRFYEYVYGRRPNSEEINRSVLFIENSENTEKEDQGLAEAWSYGFGEFDKASGKITNYKALPSFNGSAWGGGSEWPDPALGWVRLTAEGGHVGNSVKHAAVRRWRSASSSQIQIAGFISKVEECGDGIRAWISSSRKGLIAKWRVEFGKEQPAIIKNLQVEEGEVIDFIVDCGEKDDFYCDGFLWAPVIKSIGEEISWSARTHFSGQGHSDLSLSVWQRFAQALLISNEVMFLD